MGWLWAEGDGRLECRWVGALVALPGAVAPVKGFGASDCARGCPAHLVLLPAGCGEADLMAALTGATPGGTEVRRSGAGG